MKESAFRVRTTLLSQRPHSASFSVVLLTVALMCSISGIYWEKVTHIYPLLAATPLQVFELQEYWRLLTTIFVHGDIKHLVSNVLPFSLFAYFLYGYFGFRVFPVQAFLLGALVNLISLYTYPSSTTLIGASGVVYLIGAFWLTMYVLLHRRYSLRNRMVRSFGFALLLFFPRSYELHVSYRTHAIGFGLGIAWALAYYFRNKQKLRAAEIVEAFQDEEWERIEH